MVTIKLMGSRTLWHKAITIHRYCTSGTRCRSTELNNSDADVSHRGAEEEHGLTAPTGDQLHGDLEINFNGTPWEEDIWADKEDLIATKNSIITISKAYQIGLRPKLTCADRLQRPS